MDQDPHAYQALPLLDNARAHLHERVDSERMRSAKRRKGTKIDQGRAVVRQLLCASNITLTTDAFQLNTDATDAIMALLKGPNRALYRAALSRVYVADRILSCSEVARCPTAGRHFRVPQNYALWFKLRDLFMIRGSETYPWFVSLRVPLVSPFSNSRAALGNEKAWYMRRGHIGEPMHEIVLQRRLLGLIEGDPPRILPESRSETTLDNLNRISLILKKDFKIQQCGIVAAPGQRPTNLGVMTMGGSPDAVVTIGDSVRPIVTCEYKTVMPTDPQCMPVRKSDSVLSKYILQLVINTYMVGSKFGLLSMMYIDRGGLKEPWFEYYCIRYETCSKLYTSHVQPTIDVAVNYLLSAEITDKSNTGLTKALRDAYVRRSGRKDSGSLNSDLRDQLHLIVRKGGVSVDISPDSLEVGATLYADKGCLSVVVRILHGIACGDCNGLSHEVDNNMTTEQMLSAIDLYNEQEHPDELNDDILEQAML